MAQRRTALLLPGLLVVLAACSATVASGTADDDAPAPASPADTAADVTTTQPPERTTTSDSSSTSSSSSSSSTSTSSPTTSSSTSSSTSTTSSTTTTTTTLPLPVHDASCIHVVEPGESLSVIAERIDDEAVTVANLQGENYLDSETIHPGEYLDVCVDNGIDDVSGEERQNPVIVQTERQAVVEVQQRKLNELFAPLGSPELLVDGISGPLTRQMLCAARLGLGLPVSTADMEAGSDEEATLLAADRIVVPWNQAVLADRWALVDRTCQIMFVGQRAEQLSFVFPVSTGEEGHETDLQTRAPSFRYDPEIDNGGWHNSTTYPVAADNPLNGNMYRPIYFNDGEAIHGASVVPPYPRSKGCVRMRVQHQDVLVSWLGLDDAGGPVWSSDRIDLRVTVQGDYAG